VLAVRQPTADHVLQVGGRGVERQAELPRVGHGPLELRLDAGTLLARAAAQVHPRLVR
jgi:hypothetical protein